MALFGSKRGWIIIAGLALAIFGAGCRSLSQLDPPTTYEAGQITPGEDIFGTFYLYVPTTVPAEPDIVVLVHGTPAKEDTAEATAHYYLVNWLDFAEEQGLILIAPAFNQEDFSSRKGDHALGGYRGLLGRKINADQWVLRLVRAQQATFGVSGRRFYLYGHSAGGQFVARFLVTHPEVVKQAVISSAATYPQPAPAVSWPFGLGELHTDIEWDRDTIKRIDVVPDQEKWLAATQVPLTVIVGLNDTSSLPQFPGQQGRNRLTIGRNWVRDMAALAEANGLECQFQLEMIPGKGHSMSGLMRYTGEALVDLPLTSESMPTQEPSLPASPPTAYWPAGRWRTSTPEQQGIDSARLVDMLDHIQAESYPVHGIAIVRNGYLVMEAYFHPFRAEDRHYIASCTKSFVSTLIGIALVQEDIDSLDHKVLDFFPDRTVANAERDKQAITVEHLLTMSSGLSWPGRGLSETLQPQMSQSQDWVQFVLDRPLAQEPGTIFRYNSGGSHLLAAIIRQTTGQTPLAFAQENLFNPLEITNVSWPSDPTGLNFGGGGLELTLSDLARFGYLYLRQGVWQEQVVLPAAWVATATTSRIETGYMDYDYGYQWWVDPAGGYHARGYGGQYIFVIPDRNMVVVLVSGFAGPDMETVPSALLKTFIIPAATSTEALPANSEQVALLESRLGSLAQPESKPVPPLPPIAESISGQTYWLEANAGDIQAFTLRFSEKPAGQAWLELVYGSGPVEGAIGLDDVYRFSPSAGPPAAMAMKGAWTSDKAFKLTYMQAGYTGHYWFIFEEKSVKVHFESPWGTETVTGIAQE